MSYSLCSVESEKSLYSDRQICDDDNRYKSNATPDVGYLFQKEILFHFCLMLMQMNCEDFAVQYEAKKFPKFDDIVCEFKYKGKTRVVLVQSKHTLNTKTKITQKALMSKAAQQKFRLHQYFEPLLDIVKSFPEEHNPKLVILTTASMDVRSYATKEDQTDELSKLFGDLKKQGAKALRFTTEFERDIENILKESNTVYMNLSKHTRCIRESLIFVTQSPDYQKLCQINNQFFEEHFNKNDYGILSGIVRTEIINYNSYDMSSRKRKAITKFDFERILNTALDRLFKSQPQSEPHQSCSRKTYNDFSSMETEVRNDFSILMTIESESDCTDEERQLNVRQFCDKLLNWESTKNFNIGFLHIISKIIEHNESYGRIVHTVFEYLHSVELANGFESLLVKKLHERDTDGNIPLQVCALKANSFFFKELVQCLVQFSKTNLIIKMMENRNYEDENFFHCFGKREQKDISQNLQEYFKICCNRTKIYELLKQQDKSGKIPIHEKWGISIINYCIGFLGDELIVQLLKMTDQEKNNVFHHMSKYDNEAASLYEIDILRNFVELPYLREAIKISLVMKNNRNETPIDVCQKLQLKFLYDSFRSAIL